MTSIPKLDFTKLKRDSEVKLEVSEIMSNDENEAPDTPQTQFHQHVPSDNDISKSQDINWRKT